jgi:gliding motility-associated-like protein
MMNNKKIYCYLAFFLLLTLNIRAQYVFSADKNIGCDSLQVKFSYSSTVIGDTIIWDLGNGTFDSLFAQTDTLIVNYKNNGYYPVFVYLNSDTLDPEIRIDIRVYRTASSIFTITDTSSVSPGSFYFSHVNNFTEPNGEYTFLWDFGDGNTGTGEDIIHTYSTSGSYDVMLSVQDTFGCRSYFTTEVLAEVPVLQLLPDITANVNGGCDSLKVKFALANVDTDTILSIIWDFGNGMFSNLIDPDTVKYISLSSKTSFTVLAIINGNQLTIEKRDFITVHHTVNPFFECLDTLTSHESINLVCFNTDHRFDTTAEYSFNWQFEGIGSMENSRPLVSYPGVLDTIQVQLRIINETYGCADSVIRNIVLYPEIQIQNVFTPNDDNRNDHFYINSLIPLQIKIFNRYGILVYQGEGTRIIWDGTNANGKKLEPGVYYYVLQSLAGDPGKKYNKTGFIHLFK